MSNEAKAEAKPEVETKILASKLRSKPEGWIQSYEDIWYEWQIMRAVLVNETSCLWRKRFMKQVRVKELSTVK